MPDFGPLFTGTKVSRHDMDVAKVEHDEVLDLGGACAAFMPKLDSEADLLQ
jgi:hypothetical protein